MPSIDLPPLGLGTYDNTEPAQCAASVRTALEAGYRHVDTAQAYGNEAAVGEGVRAAAVPREDVVVTTKLAPRNLAHDDAIATAHESADRLGLDVIDLLYVHWPIRTYEPSETLPALDRLVADGLVGQVGLSNFEPDLLAEAIEILDAPVAAHQVEMHPMLHQERLLASARDHDHWLVAYSPVAKGGVGEVPELSEIAEVHGATPFQVSLAWLHSKPGVVPIPKATSEAHIRENLAALDLELTDEELDRIDGIDVERRLVDFDSAPWNRAS